MNQGTSSVTARVKQAVLAELDLHSREIDATDTESSEIHVTVKMRNKSVRKVMYSRMTERDLS